MLLWNYDYNIAPGTYAFIFDSWSERAINLSGFYKLINNS